jgi:DNA polymerase
MSPDDPSAGRSEAAGIVQSLRRRLERERAAGSGDLMARAASPGATRRRVSAAPAASAPPAAPAPPAASAISAVTLPAVETDLFGAPVPRAAPRPAVSATEPALPPAEAPLNPAGWEARAVLAAAAEPVLARIAAEVRACQKCGLWESRSQAVPGVGSAHSGIVFIGEAPGADEDRLGEPFVGRAGQLLDKIILAMDDAKLIPGVPLSRATVFIGNIIHCRPPENRVPLPFEIEQSSPYLRRQLEALRPRVICCLGKTAAEFLLGSKGSLASMRGKVYRYASAKLIVTYHPAACLRNPDYKRPVWEDMQFLAREYVSD